MRRAVLSPHLDDAVLSASATLADVGSELVTLFAGAPPRGMLAGYDRYTGAASSTDRLRERLAEDDNALAVLGRDSSTIRLAFPDLQFRSAELDEAALADALRPIISSCDEIWAPTAIGGHPDHQAARSAALSLASPGAKVMLYADVPYCLLYGWPPLLSGRPPQRYLDIDAWLEQQLVWAGLDLAALRRPYDVRRLLLCLTASLSATRAGVPGAMGRLLGI
jgi:LmbE family N-acetylglucosaminyl deacetylase